MSDSDLMLDQLRRKVYTQDVLNRLGYKPIAYPEFRSQFFEDGTAWDILDHQLEGNYVEVGGFDGKTFSVTSVFDAMGWDGVLIEPILHQHAKSIRNRPNASHVHAAIGNRHAFGEVEFTEVIGGGMFSGIDVRVDPKLKAAAMPTKKVRVPTMSMDQALFSVWCEPVTIDLAVIDVEGNEADLLDGFSLDVWRPRLVIIEDNSFGKDKTLDPFFEKDYHLIGYLACNRLYGRRDDEIIMRWVNPTA